MESLFSQETLESSDGVTGIGIVILAVATLLTLSLQRRHAALPLLAIACYMPLGQAIMIGGLHFPFFRVLLLIALFRVLSRQECQGITLNRIDRLFIVWLVVSLVLGLFTKFSWGFLVRRASAAYDAGLCYYFIRCIIRNPEEFVGNLRFLAIMILPLAAFTFVEKLTGRNLFAFLGGVPWLTGIRDEAIRCQGPFRHPILAGTFAATLLPLLIGLWWQDKKHRRRALMGIGACLWVVGAASSSGALMAVIVSGIGALLWRMRHQMRYFRRGTVLALLAAALFMNAPVWYLIARVSEVTGGTGWHRSYLIDQAIKHFGEWWLVGTAYTAHWAPAGQVLIVDPDNMDITNNFIFEGINGGIAKLGLFVALIIAAFKVTGAGARADNLFSGPTRRLYWLVGVCLACHCVSFISIAYFDQMIIFWYWLLATVAMLASWHVAVIQKQPAKCDERDQVYGTDRKHNFHHTTL